MRCVEIASGSVTEKEKNATKKSEINSECPSIVLLRITSCSGVKKLEIFKQEVERENSI